MKIEQTGSNNQIIRTEQKKTGSVKKGSSSELMGAGKQTESVKMAFSESARLLANARAALDESSDVRNELVAELKEKIMSGDYEVPYADLADKLLSIL